VTDRKKVKGEEGKVPRGCWVRRNKRK